MPTTQIAMRVNLATRASLSASPASQRLHRQKLPGRAAADRMSVMLEGDGNGVGEIDGELRPGSRSWLGAATAAPGPLRRGPAVPSRTDRARAAWWSPWRPAGTGCCGEGRPPGGARGRRWSALAVPVVLLLTDGDHLAEAILIAVGLIGEPGAGARGVQEKGVTAGRAPAGAARSSSTTRSPVEERRRSSGSPMKLGPVASSRSS